MYVKLFTDAVHIHSVYLNCLLFLRSLRNLVAPGSEDPKLIILVISF